MGWLGTNLREEKLSVEDFIRQAIESEIIELEVKEDAAYVAYRDESGVARAVVCALKREGAYLYVKYIGEEAHPYYYDCPERIIERLDPADSSLARRWRERCLLRSAGKDPLRDVAGASQDELVKLVHESPWDDVRNAAIRRLDQKHLAEIIVTHEDVFVRREAIGRIKDRVILQELAARTPYERTRDEILERLPRLNHIVIPTPNIQLSRER